MLIWGTRRVIMWLRLAGALLVTLAAIGALEYFGVSRVLGGRTPEHVNRSARQPQHALMLLDEAHRFELAARVQSEPEPVGFRFVRLERRPTG